MNLDQQTVADFGREWATCDQSRLDEAEAAASFGDYFHIFPWEALPESAEGFDLGCGSGRWAKLVLCQPRVRKLNCVDASLEAITAAKWNLKNETGVCLYCASVDAMPLADASQDFGYSIGVLHHVPDTSAGLKCCVKKLKPGAPFLVYLYYRFDNRPWWFRFLWSCSDAGRRLIARLPFWAKRFVTWWVAALVYWPLSSLARLLERLGLNVDAFPLSYYRDKSWLTLRTDALDRFGTRLEHRFLRGEIDEMMRAAGLERIKFSDRAPYWCAVGYRSQTDCAGAFNAVNGTGSYGNHPRS